MTTNPGDDVSTIVWNFGTVPNTSASEYTALISGWNAGGTEGPLVPGTVFAVASPNAAFNINDGFDGVVATFDLWLNGNGFQWEDKSITFDVAANAVGVLNGAGQRLHWDARYAISYSGYIAYGDFGNPGWGTKTAMGHQPTPNPLIMIKDRIPEPSSLVLLTLGGFALLRRRHLR